MKKSIRIGDGVAEFFGTHDGNVKYLESLLKVQVQIDDQNNLTIDGDDHNVDLVERLVQDYAQLRSEGVRFDNGDLKSIIRIISEDTTQSLRGVVSSTKTLQAGKRNVTPKTLNQKLYLEAIEKFDMVFGIGPAGTGKTYLAVSMAVRCLLEKKISRIVLTRPAVEAGERLGFLPGTLQEKIDPYLKPLYDALYDMLDVERVDRHIALHRQHDEFAELGRVGERSQVRAFARCCLPGREFAWLAAAAHDLVTVPKKSVRQRLTDHPGAKLANLRHDRLLTWPRR